MKVEGRTVYRLPTMRMREFLGGFRRRIRDKWVAVNEDRLAEKYPIGTEKHIGWEIV